jgi:hypothetical protein
MHGALASLGLPLWAIALVFAAFAPFLARAWARWAEHGVRERSAQWLAPLRTVSSITPNANDIRPSDDGAAPAVDQEDGS